VDVDAGGVHAREIDVDVTAVGIGARAADGGPSVDTDSTEDAADSPTAFTALTLNEYCEFVDSPVTVKDVAVTGARVRTQCLLADASPAVMSVVKVITAPTTPETVKSLAFGVASQVLPVASASRSFCPERMDGSGAASVTVLGVPSSIEATSAVTISSMIAT